MIALLVDVEISDQMGTSEVHFIGVYDDAAAMAQQKEIIDRKYYDRRHWWIEKPCELNVGRPPK